MMEIPHYVVNTLALIGAVTLVWGLGVIILGAIGDKLAKEVKK